MNRLLIILCLCVSVGWATDIIPDSRRVEWSTNTCGIPGGIPNRLVVNPALNPGDDIQGELNSCASNGVVLLNPGIYNISSPIKVPNGVTLRGSGMANTFIVGQCPNVDFQGLVYIGADPGNKRARTIASGYTKGSTTIVLSADETSYIKTNSIISIDQADDSTTYPIGTDDGGSAPSYNSERGGGTSTVINGISNQSSQGTSHHRSQNVIVTGISGTTITFWPPLLYDLQAANSPSVFWRGAVASSYPRYSGIEDLTVSNTYTTTRGSYDISSSSSDRPPTGRYNNLGMYWAAYCWAKNVQSRDSFGTHFELDGCYRCEVRGCIFTNSLWYSYGGAYGLYANYTSSTLFEDNISIRTRDFIRLNAGSAGNSVLYNYHTNVLGQADTDACPPTGGSHHGHPLMNLWEGNVMYTPQWDCVHGGRSRETIFRNWIRGPYRFPAFHVNTDGTPHWAVFTQLYTPLQTYKFNDNFNIVGNILGCIEVNTDTRYTSGRRVIRLSNQTWPSKEYATIAVGYNGKQVTSSGWDATNQFIGFVYGGNYDFVSGAQIWSNPASSVLISNSYFYTVPPTNFGALYWPPFNPTNATLNGNIPGLTMETMIPAGWRYAYGTNPPASVLTIAPQHLRLTNFTTMKVIATGYTNGAVTNLSDVVGFGDYSPNTVNGFFIKTNTGLVIGSSYQWLQGTANFLSVDLPPSVNKQVPANHPLTNSITFTGFTNTALNTDWTWGGGVYSYDAFNWLATANTNIPPIQTNWILISENFWWTNSSVHPDIGPYVLMSGGPTDNAPIVTPFASPTFAATATTYYLWLDSGSYPGGGTYSDNVIRPDPPIISWSVVPRYASIDDWGFMTSTIDPVNYMVSVWGTWGQLSNKIDVVVTDGTHPSAPAIDLTAQKAVMTAKNLGVAY